MPRRKIDRSRLSPRKLSLNKSISLTPESLPGKSSKKNNKTTRLSNASDSLNTSAGLFRKLKNPENLNVLELLKVTWKVHRVSPLYNFNEEKIRVYERKIKEELLQFYCNAGSTEFECKISNGNLAFENPFNVLKFYVRIDSNKYFGYLIRTSESLGKENDVYFKHYPILLARGGEKLLKCIHNTICKFFDCDIHPVSFSYDALTTFFATVSQINIQYVAELQNEVILSLQYRIPGCPNVDTITADLPVTATSTVLAAINMEFGNYVPKTEIVKMFYESILNHIRTKYGVDLSRAELIRLKFPNFNASFSGLVRFYSDEYVEQMLPIIEVFTRLVDNFNMK